MKFCRIILVSYALLWGSVDAFALRSVSVEKRCTGLFRTEVYRARYFNPQTGRFWTADSWQGNPMDPQSLHKYLYCNGNPVNNSDPSGHDGSETLVGQLSVGQIMAITAGALYAGYAIGKSRAWQTLGNITINSINQAITAAAISAAAGVAVAKTMDEVKVEVDELVASTAAAANNRIFVHSTTTDHWPGLTSSQSVTIDPNKNPYPRMLDFGIGFYTWQLNDPNSAVSAMQSAFNWVARPTHGVGVLAVFRMDEATYEGLNKRQASPGEAGLVKGDFSTGYDLVYGPVSGEGSWAWQYKFEGRGMIELSKGFLGAVPLVK